MFVTHLHIRKAFSVPLFLWFCCILASVSDASAEANAKDHCFHAQDQSRANIPLGAVCVRDFSNMLALPYALRLVKHNNCEKGSTGGLSCDHLRTIQSPPSTESMESSKAGKGSRLKLAGTGTAFAVSKDGILLTNAHVVQKCESINVRGQHLLSAPSEILAIDRRNDLALLRAASAPNQTAAFQLNRKIRTGEDIVVVGYPLYGILGKTPNVTKGVISSLVGMADDPRLLQITAPIQLGNSGGPVIDDQGAVVGIVVSKLNAIAVATATGDIPQNVNFAIKGSVAISFLEVNDVPYAVSGSKEQVSTPDIAEDAKRYVLVVECYRTPKPKMNPDDASRDVLR